MIRHDAAGRDAIMWSMQRPTHMETVRGECESSHTEQQWKVKGYSAIVPGGSHQPTPPSTLSARTLASAEEESVKTLLSGTETSFCVMHNSHEQ